MKSTLISLLALLTLTTALPSPLSPRQSTLESTTDTYLFTYSIAQFIAARTSHSGPAELDWSSDGCSSSPDDPFGFDFLNSCYRHDFGYRNFKAQGRFTDANKARIDSNFKSDMYRQCETEELREACEATATVYYEAVRVFGKKRGVEVRRGKKVELDFQ